MDQISRPFQIALLLTVLLAGLWFVALRPKPPEPAAPASTPPAQPALPGQPAPPARSAVPGAPGNALDTARAGAARADADARSRPGRADPAAAGPLGRAFGAPPGSPGYRSGAEAQARLLRSGNGAVVSGVVALSLVRISLQAGQARATGAPAARGASPQAVERALARRRAVVLLFYGAGSDDRGVRAELAKVSRSGGRVVVLSAPVSRVAQFGAVTRGVRVLEAPTVVVVGPNRQARALSGYTDSTEIDQAAQSALRGR